MNLRLLLPFLFFIQMLPLSAIGQQATNVLETVNMRINPSTRSKVMQKVETDMKVKILQTTSFREKLYIDGAYRNQVWVNIQLENGEEGWIYGYYIKLNNRPQIDELNQAELALLKPKVRTVVPRTFKRNYKKKDPQIDDIAYPRNARLSIKNDSLMGYIGRFEVQGRDDYERMYGKILRALRFKNITDVVEERYNLPAGILLAMIMQESSGEPLLLNGRDDGGAGLSHMQPVIAQEFGLNTLNDATGLVNEAHGKELRELLDNISRYINSIMLLDDRLNWLKNVDAVGRMLATYMSAGQIDRYDNILQSMIARYSGSINFPTYYKNIDLYMKFLNDDLTYNILNDQFSRDNDNLIINGKESENYELIDYLRAYWQFNEALFQLDKYRQLTHYSPFHSYDVLVFLPKGWPRFKEK
jgi:hypothetical protein